MTEKNMNLNMHVPSLSYIVPVYNTAEFLEDCLGSIAWSGNDIECVVINDGSTDSSLSIIEEFIESDSRFKVITQPNRGLSAARNKGLSAARGKYILCVDSDDFVDADGVMGMLEKAVQTNADIVTGNLICVDNEGGQCHWGTPVRSGVYPSGVDFLAHMFSEATYFPMAPCYMVRRELLKNINLSFREGIMHEDELWAPWLLMRAAKTVASGINHYGYRIGREGTLTHNPNPLYRFNSLIEVISGIITNSSQFSPDSETIQKSKPFLAWRLGVLESICSRLAAQTENHEVQEKLGMTRVKIAAFKEWLDGKEAGVSSL